MVLINRSGTSQGVGTATTRAEISDASGAGASSAEQGFAEARALELAGRWADARARHQENLHSPTTTMDPRLRATILRHIAGTYLEEGNRTAAMESLTAALSVSDALRDRSGVAHAYNMMGIVEQSRGNLDESERLYARARTEAEALADAKILALIDMNLGTVANIRGDYSAALHHYRASISGYRTLGMDAEQGQVLNNLAMLYTDLRRWRDADEAYTRAAAICSAGGDLSRGLRIEVNRTELLIARRKLDEARRHCEVLLQKVAAMPGAPLLGDVRKHCGVVYRELGDLEMAEAHFREAERLAATTGDLLLAAEVAREHAELQWQQNKHFQTLRLLNKAHTLFDRLGAGRDLATIVRKNQRLENRFLEIVQRWSNSIESKDRYTQGHCERVASLACTLARRLGYDDKNLFWFRIGALLHDVGKLIVPSEVLNKPGKLTDEEWLLMRRHPVAGLELLGDIDFPWDVRPMVRNHHERWDGRGYPDGLSGRDTPFAARILCVADVYDALTTTRSYRVAYGHSEALGIMVADRGMFDPELIRHFTEWGEHNPNGFVAVTGMA
jgi:putative nucleotidyltransferase with HDIG domain